MARLLVIDDEPNIRFALAEGLSGPTLEVVTAQTAREGLEQLAAAEFDVVLLDVRLPDRSGLDVFGEIHQIDPHLPVIVITAYSTSETAIEAMKRGAFEYLIKPVDLAQLDSLIATAVQQRRLSHVPAVFEAEPWGEGQVDRIVGQSACMQAVYKAIGQVAERNVSVLILGESGTGKELVARAIYRHSDRHRGPFLAINCAAIPEALLESELFGHERGAFTGADRRRIGKFEQAHGGTIFLDEVGDMSPATQARVLRLLQEQCFERVGGNETIRTDVRVIAATNQRLDDLVAAGRFREDLYFRLNVFVIELPPLRERTEDLPALVTHILAQANADMGKSVQSATPETLAQLAAYDWPGNVRELQSAIRTAVVRAPSALLTPDLLPELMRERTLETQTTAAAPIAGRQPPSAATIDVDRLVEQYRRDGETDIYRKACAVFDELVLRKVLEMVDGNQLQASELLGISRTTLRAKLRSLRISVNELQRKGAASR